MENPQQKSNKPYTIEWIKENKRKALRQFVSLLLIAIIGLTLFQLNADKIYRSVLGHMNILTQSEATELVDEIESAYIGQYVFDYKDYGMKRASFLKAHFISYYDFYDYVNYIAVMANDYYSSFIFNTPEVNYYNQYITKLEFTQPNFENIDLAGKSVGYIELYGLNDNVIDQVTSTLKSYNDQGIEDVILDMTQSPLGNTESTLKFLDLFISDDELMRYQTHEGYTEIFKAQVGAYAFKHIYIMINSEVSGPGEIIALSLKNHLKEGVDLVGQPPYMVPYLFEYHIEKDHKYIFKYAVGQWQVGSLSPELKNYDMSLDMKTYNKAGALDWIEESLQR